MKKYATATGTKNTVHDLINTEFCKLILVPYVSKVEKVTGHRMCGLNISAISGKIDCPVYSYQYRRGSACDRIQVQAQPNGRLQNLSHIFCVKFSSPCLSFLPVPVCTGIYLTSNAVQKRERYITCISRHPSAPLTY